jgi:hypothetical protein
MIVGRCIHASIAALILPEAAAAGVSHSVYSPKAFDARLVGSSVFACSPAAGKRAIRYDMEMSPAHMIELSVAVKALGEHLRLLQESKSELLEALQETSKVADEVRRLLEEGRQMLAELSERAGAN